MRSPRGPRSPRRREFLGALAAGSLLAAPPNSAPSAAALSRTKFYLSRIASLDGKLGSVLETNPDALAIGAALDRAKPAGLLHGLPVLIKDNIDTAEKMRTTAGSLALLDAPKPKQDAPLVTRLRNQGAVLLGKTNLSEWANIRSSRSTSGWSGRGGQTRNPYDLTRNPSGSSSGSAVAVAANLCWAAIGTETDGSIVSPASLNGIVGIKPTVGLVSGAGIIPIAHSQDTAGPMARTVADAARLLDAISEKPLHLVAALNKDALRGTRLGLARQFYGAHPGIAERMELAAAALAKAGAEIIDPFAIPETNTYGEAEFQVLLYELKADLNAYLQARGGPIRSLDDVIDFNKKEASREMPYFGQETFEKAAKLGDLSSKDYLDARAKCVAMAATGIDEAMDKHRLDAIIAPTDSLAWPTDYMLGDHFLQGCSTPAAVAGFPHVTVPMGLIKAPRLRPLPVGLSFFGKAWSEPKLVSLAYAFEMLSKTQPLLARQAPTLPSGLPY